MQQTRCLGARGNPKPEAGEFDPRQALLSQRAFSPGREPTQRTDLESSTGLLPSTSFHLPVVTTSEPRGSKKGAVEGTGKGKAERSRSLSLSPSNDVNDGQAPRWALGPQRSSALAVFPEVRSVRPDQRKSTMWDGGTFNQNWWVVGGGRIDSEKT